ncbi:MAG: glycosyltransferase family 2 protein [Planctomycetales bacterium]|nr:glycosyltransferase family 2 protein [Planctomycetales bacterium]
MKTPTKFLTALPVYNEQAHVNEVLDSVVHFASDVLVIDDGSNDRTAELLAERLETDKQLSVVRHAVNQGYGAALRTAFQYAIDNAYDVLITIDCDGQHQPELIPQFVAAASHAEIVSGSRYMQAFASNNDAPLDRQRINKEMTELLNEYLGLSLTDSFCGFKAYQVGALTKLRLTENGYAIPLEFWVQAATQGLSIQELPVPRVYLDESRSFGGSLDDANIRRQHYLEVFSASLRRANRFWGPTSTKPIATTCQHPNATCG